MTAPSAGATDPSGGATTPDPRADYDTLEGTDPALAAYYGQDVVWGECDYRGGDECTRITVPLDYDDPDGETIEIAVARRLSAGAGAPDVFVNPGGPGGSGVEMVGWVDWAFSADLLSHYNVVGFDPRGVYGSTAVECLTDAEEDEWNAADFDPSTDEGLAAYQAAVEEFVAKCEAGSGELLAHLDTDNVARDLDILRAVVGRSSELDYMGFSYGTFLGAVYADHFTDRVGRFLLDGAVDPALNTADLEMGQSMGFERAIRSYMEDCLAGPSCWTDGTVEEGLAQITQLIEVATATPLPTNDPDRPLTGSLALSGIFIPLYDSSSWSMLTNGLDAAINNNDGATLLMMADLGNSRNPDGTYEGNGGDAFMPINCMDYPVIGTIDDWRAHAEEMAELYPTFGQAIGYSNVTCAALPYQSERVRGPIAAAGSAPILVVGTTRDPATPYEWSVAMADQLEQGHLLTYDGDGHTAYGRGSACVDAAVDAFMIDGTIPDEGATC